MLPAEELFTDHPISHSLKQKYIQLLEKFEVALKIGPSQVKPQHAWHMYICTFIYICTYIQKAECHGFESHPGQLLFPLKKELSWLHPLIHLYIQYTYTCTCIIHASNMCTFVHVHTNTHTRC